MNGSAPNWPATGSQVVVRQKSKPNFRMESPEVRSSSKRIPRTRRTTRDAKNPVPRRKPRSSARRREEGVFIGRLSLGLDLLERFHLQGDDLRGQRRVAEVRRVLLPVRQ